MEFTFFFALIILAACNGQEQKKQQATDLPEAAVGVVVYGDYNGDGIQDTAKLVQTQKGSGNPVEDGTPDAYEVQFSGNILPAIPIGCCEAVLIHEGPLTGSGDALSVYQAPMNGCTYTFTTYDFSGNKPRKIIGPFLIPTGCEPLSDEALQERVFKEGDAVYYYETDPNSKTGELVKVRAAGF